MASVNRSTKEMTCKLVYYGPGMCGKTTNLQYLHQHPVSAQHGEFVSLATPGERTLYFDFFSMEMPDIGGYKVKFGLYTVPGQVMYNATRKLVLRGADGIVFVADSQWNIMQENLDSVQNLKEDLASYDVKLEDLPYVIQYNKRDLPDIAPIWYLDYLVNTSGVPAFEAAAIDGTGVYETLSALCRYVIRDVVNRFEAGVI
jgi:signal recognition particle receptor subunit beta